MSDSGRTLPTWDRRQLRVARQMALGHSQVTAARLEDVPLRTVQYWVANDDLELAADMLAARGWERLDPALWRNVEMALDVQHRVMAGELGFGSDPAKEARWILDRALRRAAPLGGSEPGDEAAFIDGAATALLAGGAAQ